MLNRTITRNNVIQHRNNILSSRTHATTRKRNKRNIWRNNNIKKSIKTKHLNTRTYKIRQHGNEIQQEFRHRKSSKETSIRNPSPLRRWYHHKYLRNSNERNNQPVLHRTNTNRLDSNLQPNSGHDRIRSTSSSRYHRNLRSRNGICHLVSD